MMTREDQERADANKQRVRRIMAGWARMAGAELKTGTWSVLGRNGCHQLDLQFNGRWCCLEFSREYMEDADSAGWQEKIGTALRALVDGRAQRARIGHTLFELVP